MKVSTHLFVAADAGLVAGELAESQGLGVYGTYGTYGTYDCFVGFRDFRGRICGVLGWPRLKKFNHR